MNEVMDKVTKYGSALRKSSIAAKFGWLIAGAALGAVATYFLDPKMGSERRLSIKKRATKLNTDISDAAEKQYTSVIEKVDAIASFLGIHTDSKHDSKLDSKMDLDRDSSLRLNPSSPAVPSAQSASTKMAKTNGATVTGSYKN